MTKPQGGYLDMLGCLTASTTLMGLLSVIKKTQVFSSMRSPSIKEQVMLWHLRLGHPNFFYLKYLFPNLFKGVDCSLFIVKVASLQKVIIPIFPPNLTHPQSLST